MDNVASLYGRNNLYDVIHEATKNIFIPITVGGGIRSEKDAHKILRAGADKIAINTAAVKNPKLVIESSKKFGSQCIVVAIDAKKNGDKWEIFTHGGRNNTGIDALEFAKKMEESGAGELLVTSMDRDGMKRSPNFDETLKVANTSNCPVIISGGVSSIDDIKKAKELNNSNIEGIIVGKAIYDGDIKLDELAKEVDA